MQMNNSVFWITCSQVFKLMVVRLFLHVSRCVSSHAFGPKVLYAKFGSSINLEK